MKHLPKLQLRHIFFSINGVMIIATAYFVLKSFRSIDNQTRLYWPGRTTASRYRKSLIKHYETERFQDPNAFYKLADFPVNETLFRPKYTWKSTESSVKPLTILNGVYWLSGVDKYCPNLPCKFVSQEQDAALVLRECNPLPAHERHRHRIYFSVCYEPHRAHQSDNDTQPANIFYSSFLKSSTIPMFMANRDADIRRFVKHLLEPMNVTLKNIFRKEPYNASLISYVSSNCVSIRDDYVAELAKHVSVDAYGRCLNNKSKPLDHEMYYPEFFKTTNFPNGNRDEFRLKFGYKFCIAMSSSTETDYITEKFFHAIYAGCVPIVNAKEGKYRRVLPGPKSAIFTEDFASPEELAKYLKKLDENDDLYGEYFKWRKNGLSGSFLNALQRTEETALCRICDFAYDYLFKNEL